MKKVGTVAVLLVAVVAGAVLSRTSSADQARAAADA